MKTLLIDIETRSRCDLKTAGARRYAADPSTQITTAVWKWHRDTEVRSACFVKGLEGLAPQTQFEFVRTLQEADRVVAHNIAFDINVITGQWPLLKFRPDQLDCTQGRAQRMSLPGGLDAVSKALAVEGKSQDGSALVMATCKPQRNGTFNENPDIFRKLLAYNVQDVRALESIHDRIAPLSPEERVIWERTWRKNGIGLPIDLELAQAIADRREQVELEVANELKALTGGVVSAISQRARISRWLASRGCELPNTRRDTIEEALDTGEWPFDVFRVLEHCRDSGGMAPTKAQALLDRHVGGYYKDATRYFGTRSGRGTSEGANLFNIARPSGKYDVPDVIRRLKAGDRTLNNTALTDALRGTICAPPGYRLLDCDYKNGELRKSLWLSGDHERLTMLANNGDLYAFNGTVFFGIPNITKETHPMERQFAKKLTLSCGYQCGGVRHLTSTQSDTTIDLAFRQAYTLERAKADIAAYRAANPKLADLKTGLWGELDRAAKHALWNKGAVIEAAGGKVAFCMDRNGVFWLRLPSGRAIPHYNARITEQGEFEFYRGKQGRMQKQKAYGGAWLEITCQSSLRDSLTEAEQAIEQELPDVFLILDIYDSIVAITHESVAAERRKQIIAIMSRGSKWAPGLPMGADAGKPAERMGK